MIPTTAQEQHDLAALLARVARGDHPALAELYDRTSPILYGLLMRMLRNPERAQEALQETYIRIWQRAETYVADRGEPIAWLIGVARYRALDQLRAHREIDRDPGELENDPEAVALQAGAVDHGPEAGAVQREGLERLLRCLGGLTQVQRKSVLLAYYEGYSHTELARAMDAPLGTVKAWIRRGLARLRECLER